MYGAEAGGQWQTGMQRVATKPTAGHIAMITTDAPAYVSQNVTIAEERIADNLRPASSCIHEAPSHGGRSSPGLRWASNPGTLGRQASGHTYKFQGNPVRSRGP
jgi:hypothetical protein